MKLRRQHRYPGSQVIVLAILSIVVGILLLISVLVQAQNIGPGPGTGGTTGGGGTGGSGVPNGSPPQIVGYSAANVGESETLSGDCAFTRAGANSYTIACTQANGTAFGTLATKNAGTGLSVGGSNLNLANTAVTPGSYTNSNITVDAQGRLTAASNGAAGGGGTINNATQYSLAYYSTAGSSNFLSGVTPFNGLAKFSSSAAPVAAVSGTDYLAPPSGTSLLKANSGGALANAVAGTDYLAPPAGTSLLKGNSGGALANAASGTDYAPATSGTSILKGNNAGGFANAVAGTDYPIGSVFNHTAPVGNATLTCTNVTGSTASTDFYQGKLSGANVTYTLPASAIGCVANDMIALDITNDASHTVTVNNGAGTTIPNPSCPPLPSGNDNILNVYYTYDLGPSTPAWFAHCGGTSPGSGNVLNLYQLATPASTNAAQSTNYDLVTFSVPGGTLGTTHSIDFAFLGKYVNASTSDQPTFTVSYGGTNLFTGASNSLTSSASGRSIRFNCHLSSNGTTGGQTGGCLVRISTVSSQSTGAAASGTWDVSSQNDTIALDSTAAQTFKITYNDTASANSVITVESATINEQ